MNKIVEILQHNISYWFDKDEIEIDEINIEHIEEKIKEGYFQGELCQYIDNSPGISFETRGWWKIEVEDTTCKCGDANKGGNVEMFYKGGCKSKLDIKDAYRCVGCGGWFHKECLIEHFKLEKEHDWGRLDEHINIIKKLKALSEDLYKQDMLEFADILNTFILQEMLGGKNE